MYKILALNKISEKGLNILPKDKYSVLDNEKNPDGILLRSFSMHDMELPETLLAVARAGAGVNNIPIDKCSEKGIVVFNTPGANANAVKELVMTALFISSRKIVDGIKWVESLKGQEGISKLVEKGKSEFVGPEITGKKIGVIGLGAIGVLVSNACKSLGMEVLGYDPFLSVDAAWALSRGVHKASGLDEIFEQCDYITVHIPFNDKTKEMFNKETFAKVKKGVRIINLARGELVNNSDIKEAIENGIVSCYITDFPNEEVVGVKNIITIPHLGASTPEAEDNCAEMASIEISDYIENGNIKNSVNFPDCELPLSGRVRICIIHKNMPNVVGPITSKLAENGLNIDNMINKSKGSYAYTMIDVDQDINDSIKNIILSVDGAINVRIIK